jgi:hypothetical protein
LNRHGASINEKAEMKALRRAWLVSTIFLTLVSLTACSRGFIIKPSGQFDQQLTFEFYKSIGANEPVTLNIVEFVIQEKKTESNWQTVWQLKGKQSLNAITYAKKYERLEEIVSPKPISREAEYRVLASELGSSTPIGYSTLYFAFDQSGTVTAVDPK